MNATHLLHLIYSFPFVLSSNLTGRELLIFLSNMINAFFFLLSLSSFLIFIIWALQLFFFYIMDFHFSFSERHDCIIFTARIYYVRFFTFYWKIFFGRDGKNSAKWSINETLFPSLLREYSGSKRALSIISILVLSFQIIFM